MMPRAEDLRDAFSALRKQPLETAVTLLILALGIGATSAAFSLVDGVVLRPLPYPEPSRLVGVHELTPSDWEIPVSPARFRAWSEAPGGLDALAAATEAGFDLTGPAGPTGSAEPERVAGARVSAGFFDLLGAHAARGRLFDLADDRPDGAPVAVVGDGFWRRRFAADPGLVGSEIVLTGQPYTVIGVLDPGFRPPDLLFDERPEIWTALGPSVDPAEGGSYFLQVLGRLPPGTGPDAAGSALAAIGGSEGFGVRAFSLGEATVGEVRSKLILFLGAVGLLLLAACANVGGILLARGSRRERDLSVRAALGADRSRIVALLTAEGALLALGAAAGGLLVARGGVALIRALFAGEIPRLAEVGVDRRAFLFTLGLAILSVLLAGLLPAWQTARRALAAGMRPESRRGTRLRPALLVAEVALAMVLVIGSALLGRSLAALSAVDPGFDTDDRLAMELSLDPARHPEPAARHALFDQVLERVRAVPGVRGAAIATTLPFGRGSAVVSFQMPGSEERRFASFVGVGEGYFEVLRIPLRAGREVSPLDRAGGAPVAVISESLARDLWGGARAALGRRIPLAEDDPSGGVEVVGVAADVRLGDLAGAPGPVLYRPFAQTDDRRAAMVARTDPGAGPLAGAFRRALWAVDPRQPVSRVAPLAELVSGSLREPRASSTLFGLFAALAALLSALGLYGTMTETVVRRTHEVGVRMALGADRRRVMELVMRRALGLTAIGIALGALAAWYGSRLLEGMLFEVAPTDPIIYALVGVLLLAIGTLAAWAPARRAARTDPTKALAAR